MLLALSYLKFIKIIFKNSVLSSPETNYISITKKELLILFSENIESLLFSETVQRRANKLCVQSSACLNVRAGGRYGNHCDLKCEVSPCSRDFLQKVIITQLVKKFNNFSSNQIVYTHVNNDPLLEHILSHLNPFHILTSHFFKIFNSPIHTASSFC